MAAHPYPGLLQAGSTGPAVRELQRQLHDVYRNPRLAVDGIFGPATRKVVIAFQAHRNLDVDGVVGPITWARVFRQSAPAPPPHSDLAARALAIQTGLLGVHEQGTNNRGPMVDQIIRYAGGDLGEPWCVDTIIWSYGHAGSTIVRPGYTRAVSAMKVAGVVATAPFPGCIVRFTFDHVGLLVADHGSVVETIDGNTGDGDRSDGTSDGVARKFRAKSLVHDYLRVTA